MGNSSTPLISFSVPERVARTLHADIVARRRPGDRLPTVIELSRTFDVSKHSISTALDILSRQGYIKKRQGRGVFVAERRFNWRVGILSELDLFDHRIGHHFRAVVGALTSLLDEAGAEPRLYTGNALGGSDASDEPTCPRFWDDLAAGGLDGAVLLDVPSTSAWQARVRSCPIPAVGAMTGFSVQMDNDAMADAAVKALAAEGCRRLGLIAWHGADAFRRAVTAHGLTTHDAWIRSELDAVNRGAGWEEFREIWLSDEKPDGLVILDDMLFADAQLAIMELGVRVPDDLRLVVQVNRGASPPIRLPVTALEVDPAEVASALAERMLQRLRGEDSKPSVWHIPFGIACRSAEASSAGQRRADKESTATALGAGAGISVNR